MDAEIAGLARHRDKTRAIKQGMMQQLLTGRVRARHPITDGGQRMSTVGEREILTQRRVLAFFQDVLGYAYLGHWKDRPDNGNIEEALLTDWLTRQGHNDKIIGKVLFELGKAAAVGGSKTLYDANREVYGLLRYGVKVKPDVGEQTITVWLIDWAHAESNDFAIAEEVTVAGEKHQAAGPRAVRQRHRPGCAGAEALHGVGDRGHSPETWTARRGNSSNRSTRRWQLLMAGNETEGLRYGVIETQEKYWLRWKEGDAHAEAGDNPLLRELSQLCGKGRLLEIVHDFMVFDAGIKKTCRHNQYFGVRVAQTRVQGREGGVLWHTQGSGKSLIMVWLAKWIREHVNDSRVLIVYRPHRTGRADREGVQGCQRGHLPHGGRGRLGARAERQRGMARLLAHPQVWCLTGRRHRCLHQRHPEASAQGLPGEGRDVRLRGRMPPHPVPASCTRR